MLEPIEVLSDDGHMQLLYIDNDILMVTDEDGVVLYKINMLPGYKTGLYYEQ